MYKNLSTKEAAALLQKFGPNEIKDVRRYSLLKSFLSQFNNFLTLLLIAAGGVAFFLGEHVDSLFIFLIVILNVLFGVYQEFKAEKSLAALKEITLAIVRVIRDDKEQEIDSRLLVPGDLIYLEEGSKIPADATIIKSWNFETNEASLTGESLPISKSEDSEDRKTIFMGTVVARGRAYAHITATGELTKFGQIAKTLATIEEEPTPLQKKLVGFTKQIGALGMVAALIVFFLSFVKDKDIFQSFLFAVSLAVAAVPEGLPAVMTITLAIGVDRMAKQKAIVRKLNAIETLGSITVVATDKTGTLTTNQMRIKKIWVDGKIYDHDKPPSLDHYAFHYLLLNGVLCSTASLVTKVGVNKVDVVGDTTEGALLILAYELGWVPEVTKSEWEIVDEIPFSSVTKIMTVTAKKGKRVEILTKGAPEAVLLQCETIMVGQKAEKLTAKHKSEIEKEFQNFARKGLRMLAFAVDKTFIGFVGIADPVRKEAVEAVKHAQEAGIKVLMMTGDNALTAEAIGVETGIIKSGEDILTGEQLDKYTEEELMGVLKKVRIFARISPIHKYRIVQLLQKQGEVVAVTGDGVNDAPALKQADVGVAMGMTGTDVAKETADMVITDDNFATLIHAIERGRNIFNQIKNAIKYLVACNVGEILYIFLAFPLNLPIFTPLQLLYINFVTDGLPAIALAFAPGDSGIMKQPPRRTLNILEKKDIQYIVLIGVLTALLCVLSIITGNHDIGLTMAFTTIILIQPLVLTDLWLSHHSIIKHFHLIKKPVFISAFLFPFILHPFLMYIPFFQNVFKVEALSPFALFDALLIPFIAYALIEPFKLKKR